MNNFVMASTFCVGHHNQLLLGQPLDKPQTSFVCQNFLLGLIISIDKVFGQCLLVFILHLACVDQPQCEESLVFKKHNII